MRVRYLLYGLIWITSIAKAQETVDEFQDFMNEIQRELDETIDSNKMEYDTFLENINKEYIKTINDAEKEFMDLLPGSFKIFPLENPLQPEDESKPVKIEKFVPAVSTVISLKENRNELSSDRKTESVLPTFLTTGHLSLTTENITIQFFGQNFQITSDTRLRVFNNAAVIDPEKLKLYLDTLQKTNYQEIIEQLNVIRNKLNLNDWDYFCLVGEFCKSFSTRENEQHIMAWFLLLESNYKVKIGYSRNTTYLFFASQQPIYQMPWFNIRGVRYYTLQYLTDSISTYDIDYFKGYKYINIFHDKPLLTREIVSTKTIRFPYNSNTYSLNLQYNQSYIDYYSKFPNIPIDYYFTQPVSATFKESVHSEIAPLLENKDQQDILQILLSLVQYGFNYATDQLQFKQEKYMIPEELLFYTASDCDDRTILFTFLVNELLNYNVIALDFGGHLCSAVEVEDPYLQGNFIYNGKKYIICDPTYIGAPPGIVMPPFQTKDATVIDFNKQLNDYKIYEKAWDLANKKGLMKADNNQNMFISGNGSIYFTGIMNEDSISPNTENVPSGKAHAFVACLNPAIELEWIKHLKGTGENLGYSIVPVNDKGFYVFGYFRDSLKLDKFTILAQEKGSFYVAKMNTWGVGEWLKKIDLPEVDSCTLGITVVLDSTGALKYYMPNNHYPSDNNYITQADNKGNFYLYAAIPLPFSDSSTAHQYTSGSKFDIISYLVNENNSLVEKNYPKSVSLLFTIAQYLRQNGSMIHGAALQKTVAAIDKSYITTRSDIYKGLENVSEIANSNGITMIKTIDRSPALLNPLQAEHESRLKISYVSENARIDILNGISIGNASVWNKLNYILLDKTTGEIIYDYDNHYRKKMPVHSELLN